MEKTVKSMIDTATKCFETTNDIVSAMKDGDRMMTQDLVNQVSTKLSIDAKTALTFVTYFVHSSDAVHVARGKNGGVIKGAKATK